jgi:hypothetical protein
MSVEMLRRAAESIREGYVGIPSGFEDRFELAVAEWFDAVAAALASRLDYARDTGRSWDAPTGLDAALKAARAYLGEQP